MEIDGYQVTDAVPLEDGSLSTTLVDTYGNVVATMTRDSSGSTLANVAGTGGDSDWQIILSKVTSFLDSVAKNAQQTSDEATRIANAAKGAAAGARIGYNGPVNWKPWLIAGGVVVGIFALGAVANSGRRRQ